MLGTGGASLPVQVCVFEGPFLCKEVFYGCERDNGNQTVAKRAALEYLEKQGKATAKELVVDMDSRAATRRNF
jgi:hypothetical protein